MLCADFEDRLTDYLEGTLDAHVSRAVAAHAMRCPLCHELLSEVKNAMGACRAMFAPQPPVELEARILQLTAPETLMSCDEFEEYLTDYLDGFLPAHLYHRWERHAALCARCTELPGQVVRAIGACYTYTGEEQLVPTGLHERILQATLGTTKARELRAPFAARMAARLRVWLDPIVSPQLATVATMLLVAVLVLTSTVSADGSISGMYRASLQLAERTYTDGANTAMKSAAISDNLKQLTTGIKAFVSDNPRADKSPSNNSSENEESHQQTDAPNEAQQKP